MMRCYLQERRRKRFTLIELLVVVAIIAVLASMLLPALSTARERAKRSACLSNQRSIYTGTAIFVGDHDGFLPGMSDSLSNPGALSFANVTVDPRWVDFLGGPTYDWTKRLFVDYLSIPISAGNRAAIKSNAYCPSERKVANARGSNARISYATPGASDIMQTTLVPFALAKESKWERSVSGLPRLFSYDATAYMDGSIGGGATGPGIWANTPHTANGLATGMNVVAVDGAGGWVSVNDCVPSTGGWWVYYRRVIPRRYEVAGGFHRNSGNMNASNYPYPAGSLGEQNLQATVGGVHGTRKAKDFGY